MEHIWKLEDVICVQKIEKMTAVLLTLMLVIVCITDRISMLSLYSEESEIEIEADSISQIPGITNIVEELLGCENIKNVVDNLGREEVDDKNAFVQDMMTEEMLEAVFIDTIPEVETVSAEIKTEMTDMVIDSVKPTDSKGISSSEIITDGESMVSNDEQERDFEEIANQDEKEFSNETVCTEDAFLIDDMGMIYGFRSEYADYSKGYLELPREGCVGIRRGSFVGCTENISEIHIPANIVKIEDGAMTELSSLECIVVDIENTAYMTIEGVLFDGTGTVLVAYPPARIGAYFVPGNVCSVEENAFLNTSLSVIDVRGCGLSANCLLNISPNCFIIE